MEEYKCQAKIDESKECKNICWGHTIYCMWHNCWLTWYRIYLNFFPHHRSIGWAAYDRDFLRDMRRSPIIPTYHAIRLLIFVIVFSVFANFIGIGKHSQSFYEIYSRLLWIVSGVCILTMALGNKDLLFPKLLFGTAFCLVASQIFMVIMMINSSYMTKSIIILCGRIALLLWVMPIPRGPLLNAMAEVSNNELLPPSNIGGMVLRSIGVIFYAVYAIGLQYMIKN